MSTPVSDQKQLVDNDDDVIEIRLSDVVAFLKRSRRAMLIGAVIGGVTGILYAFSKPNEYTAQITVLPEIQSKGNVSLGGSLGSLAGLAGIDVGSMASGTDAVRPELYPNVIQSIPFALTVLNQPVYAKDAGKIQPLASYLESKKKPGLLDWLPGTSNEADTSISQDPTAKPTILRLTKAQEAGAKQLQERVTGTFDKKTGVLTITSTMPEPIVAATVADLSLTYLTEYVTSYRTEKARREVDFLNKQVALAKQRYQGAEYALSAYRDQNRSVFLNTAKIEEQRIQAEFLLAQDLYNTLSKQAEMAKIKVQEDTPVFKVLEPSRIPLKKSGPQRVMLILGLALGGLFVGIIYSFFRRDR